MSWWYTLGIILWGYSQLDFDVLCCYWCTWDYWRRWSLRPKSWNSIYYEVNSIFWICLYSTFDEKHFKDHKWVVNSIAKKKKKKDIVNAMNLIKVSKEWLQVMRDDEWISLLTEVSSFCTTHDIPILNMDEIFVVSGRPWRNTQQNTDLHHYRVELFYTIIDMQLQELNNHISEVNTNLLLCMACLNPSNSFVAFD